MIPFFNFPEDETATAKEARKKKLNKLNESLNIRNPIFVNGNHWISTIFVAKAIATVKRFLRNVNISVTHPVNFVMVIWQSYIATPQPFNSPML